MLTLYRRHRASCKHKSRRYTKCFCPIWVQGVLRGKPIRESLSLTNWEAANRQVRDWEIHGPENSVSVTDAVDRFLADAEARHLKEPTLRKYRQVMGEFKGSFSGRAVRGVSID